ncbi:MAG: DUF3465 domain-containing protein [Gammaproteobacteria bacterium]|nr:DUF3465 domain-containing protein [Gammaproteobacteria bacterium]MDH3429749.1 DUF3465 domain-containing protein [Gammaproteobacteria bacterium]MDH3432913.1 DUF3465 domain-containing protein [Gammaproteobacteria bacterium]
MKRLVFIVVVVAAYYAYERFLIPELPASRAQTPGTQTSARSEQWRSGEQVRGSGTVLRLLADDNDGSRHQRFILELNSGRTVLVAHNIDLAPRISSLRTGDSVAFYGQYETNPQGGVIHWTHHDPRGAHVAGWLEHNGRRYD